MAASGYFLIVTIVIALLAVLYVWYISRDFRSIPDDKVLLLDTDEDRLLSNWYNTNLKVSYNLNIDEAKTCADLIKRLYDIEVNPDLLVIGTNIGQQYHRLLHQTTGSASSLPYFPQESPGGSHTMPRSVDRDCLFDLRSNIGKELEIAAIHDPVTRTRLKNTNYYNMNEITSIMESNLDTVARDYLKQVLKYRWDKILEINDPNILNRNRYPGTYLYLRECTIPNIQAYADPNNNIIRVNLLCTDLEFETLLKRWTQHLTNLNLVAL